MKSSLKIHLLTYKELKNEIISNLKLAVLSFLATAIFPIAFGFYSQSASADSVMTNQTIGEHYESAATGFISKRFAFFSDTTYISDYLERDGDDGLNNWNDVMRDSDFTCGSHDTVYAALHLRFPILDIGYEQAVSLADPNYSIVEKPEGIFSHQTNQCLLSTEQGGAYFYNTQASYLAATHRGIDLDTMSTDAQGISGRYELSNPKFNQMLTSGSNSFNAFLKINLKSCITTNGDEVTSFIDLDSSTSVKEIIANLRKRGFRDFVRCTLPISSINIGGDTLKNGRFLPDTQDLYLEFQSATPDKLVLQDGNDVFIDEFSRKGKVRSTANEQLAMQAAKNFVTFVENDYANFLYSLNDQATSIAERNEGIKSFFNKNSAQIIAWLSQVDVNYADVSLMNKVSMMISIQDAYATIARVEHSISDSSPVSLDQVIHQNAHSD